MFPLFPVEGVLKQCIGVQSPQEKIKDCCCVIFSHWSAIYAKIIRYLHHLPALGIMEHDPRESRKNLRQRGKDLFSYFICTKKFHCGGKKRVIMRLGK